MTLTINPKIGMTHYRDDPEKTKEGMGSWGHTSVDILRSTLFQNTQLN